MAQHMMFPQHLPCMSLHRPLFHDSPIKASPSLYTPTSSSSHPWKRVKVSQMQMRYLKPKRDGAMIA